MKPIVNINDNHRVLQDWEKLRIVMNGVEADFLKFYGPKKVKKAGLRARKKFQKMIDMLFVLRKNVLKQREDYDSEY